MTGTLPVRRIRSPGRAGATAFLAGRGHAC